MSINGKPDVSVVVAVKHVDSVLRECLDALLNATEERAVQIIVVNGTTDAAPLAAEQAAGVTLLNADPTWLVPRLWSVGIQAANAPIVALTIGQCVPDAGWIEAILAAAARHERCAGFGGSIDGPRDARWRDWALYFSRYSAYMPPLATAPTAEVAADNAAYRMAALEGCDVAYDEFWETQVHHELRKRGWQLTLAGDMRVRLGPCPSALRFCRERYLHARYFASTRPGNTRATRFARVITAPALAPFLILRIASRVAKHRRDWLTKYLAALPWLIVFMAAWSAGEAAGYLRPQPQADPR